MTVLTTQSDIQYSGFAGQVVFAYNFRVDNKSEMLVSIDGANVDQVDFTMTGLGDSLGGNVILNTGLVVNARVTLVRNIPYTQEVDYQPFTAFPAETHEGALDKLTMLMQQNNASSLNGIRFPFGDTSNAVLPVAASRANLFFGFDNNGDIAMTVGVGGGDPNAVQKPIAATGGNLIMFDSFKNALDSGHSIKTLINLMFPVGIIVEYTNATNPNVLYPDTNWEELPEGQFLISKGVSFPVGIEGGFSDTQVIEHTHTVGNDGDHVHGLGSNQISINTPFVSGIDPQSGSSPSGSLLSEQTAGDHNHSLTTTGVVGTDLNYPPYLSIYRWQRLPDNGGISAFDAHWARVLDKSDPTLEGDLRTLFDSLIANGLYGLLDDFSVIHTSQADSLLGMKGFQDSITVGGAPSWSPLSGFRIGDTQTVGNPDPLKQNFIDTGIFNTGATQLSDNSTTIFFSQIGQTAVDASILGAMGVVNEAGPNDLAIFISSDSLSSFNGANNSSTAVLLAGGNGFYVGTRNAITDSTIVKDAFVTQSALLAAGGAPVGGSVYVGGANDGNSLVTGFGNKYMVAWGVGGGLTRLQAEALRDVIGVYTTARGVAEPFPEFDAHWARVIDKSDPTLEGHLTTLFRTLVDTGVWDRMDDLCVIHTSEADSLLGLKGFQDSIAVNSPPFSASVGFTLTTGASVSARTYIDTVITSALNPNYSSGSMTGFTYYAGTAGMNFAGQQIMGQRTDLQSALFIYPPQSGGLKVQISIGALETTNHDQLQQLGFYGVTRTSTLSDSSEFIRDGAVTGLLEVQQPGAYAFTDSIIVGGVKLNGAMQWIGTVGTQDQIAWGIGGGLTTAQLIALNTAIETYVVARGF